MSGLSFEVVSSVGFAMEGKLRTGRKGDHLFHIDYVYFSMEITIIGRGEQHIFCEGKGK